MNTSILIIQTAPTQEDESRPDNENTDSQLDGTVSPSGSTASGGSAGSGGSGGSGPLDGAALRRLAEQRPVQATVHADISDIDGIPGEY